jgi:hypothetical protein
LTSLSLYNREYLEKQGVAPEIRNMFETLLAYYLNYNDANVKHNNKVYKQEVEFLLYQTGIFLRMFITLKNGLERQ